jgi:hypothetical protein
VDKLQFCTLLLPVTFLLANFLHFSQQIPNQRKILSCFDIHFQILWRKSFLVILAFFETLKPNSQETAQNFEKHVLLKCLRIAFYTYIPVNRYNFLKKHHNRSTLMCPLLPGSGGGAHSLAQEGLGESLRGTTRGHTVHCGTLSMYVICGGFDSWAP